MDIPTEEMSLVGAMQHYFTAEPNGRKIETAEFKNLTDSDKDELTLELRKLGYNVKDRTKK
jgi:hypothetical protein